MPRKPGTINHLLSQPAQVQPCPTAAGSRPHTPARFGGRGLLATPARRRKAVSPALFLKSGKLATISYPETPGNRTCCALTWLGAHSGEQQALRSRDTPSPGRLTMSQPPGGSFMPVAGAHFLQGLHCYCPVGPPHPTRQVRVNGPGGLLRTS